MSSVGPPSRFCIAVIKSANFLETLGSTERTGFSRKLVSALLIQAMVLSAAPGLMWAKPAAVDHVARHASIPQKSRSAAPTNPISLTREALPKQKGTRRTASFMSMAPSISEASLKASNLAFAYLASAAAETPSIASISPSSGPAKSSITIAGSGFGGTQGTSAVMFGGVSADITDWSDTSIVAVVPDAPIGASNLQVWVNSMSSNTVPFTILATPTMTALSINAGAVGETITITGTNFGSTQGNSTVTFSGTPATPTSWSDTSISVPVPNGATTGNVLVTVNGVPSDQGGIAFMVVPPMPAGVGFVQGNYSAVQSSSLPSSVQTVTIRYPEPQRQGDLNVIVIGWRDNKNQVQSITDTSANTYSVAAQPLSLPKFGQQVIFYAKNIFPAATNSVTITFTGAAHLPDIRIAEYKGLDTADPLDVTAGNVGTEGALSDSGFATTTNADDVLVGANLVDTSINTMGAGTDYISEVLTTPRFDIYEDRIVTAIDSYNATAPVNKSGNWIAQMVAFKEAPNQAPAVDAGPAQTITLPENTVKLNGKATDDGLPENILRTSWSQVSGPAAAVIEEPNQLQTAVTFPSEGVYTFRLTASDGELTALADTTVTVNLTTNQPPVVSAGPNDTVHFPNLYQLQGSVSDDGKPVGGTLVATWSQVSGPSAAVFEDIHSPTSQVTLNAEGVYVLRLTAGDGELRTSADVSIATNQGNFPPVVNAGPDQSIAIPVNTVNLQGTVSDDGLPTGSTLTHTWSKVLGSGEVTFSDPASLATQATFSMPGTYVLRLTAGDTELTGSDDLIVNVIALEQLQLSLTPATAGPNVVGSHQLMTATLTSNSAPVAGVLISFNVTGVNSTIGSATTNANGVAEFSYVGNNSGEDKVTASVDGQGIQLTSSESSINWVIPSQPISSTAILARFFTSDGSGSFNTPSTKQPVFEQYFPTINFNPPAGKVAGAPNTVGVNTRPFTDVTTDLNGSYTGSIIAEGNGAQAGVSDSDPNISLFNFQAVFTGAFTVSQPGFVVFSFYSDDGFILGIGNGASRVSGASTNIPPSGLTPFEGYPVMGAFNTGTAPTANNITVFFPEPGTYPYEVDYSECCAGQLALTMTSDVTGSLSIPPSGSIALTPLQPSTLATGQGRTIDAVVKDAAGAPVANTPVKFVITGANQPSSLFPTVNTDVNGHASLTYVGQTAGIDNIQAQAPVTGMIAYSNQITALWSYSAAAPEQLLLDPSEVGASVVGGIQTFRVYVRDSSGVPLEGFDVTLTVTGANGNELHSISDASGTSTFQYSGANQGEDEVRASVTVNGSVLQSDPVTVEWLPIPTHPVSTTTLTFQFFQGNGSGTFSVTPAAQAYLKRKFPLVAFNPSSGVISGNTSSVTTNSRPMVALTTDTNSAFAGTIPVESEGVQEGLGILGTSQGVATANLVVAAAGDITFSLRSDDGFLLGIGGGATRVSGDYTNVPASGVTAFHGYPIMAGYNATTGATARLITVHFPSPGSYPYEIDYAETNVGGLSLTLALASNSLAVPPAGALLLMPITTVSKYTTESQTLSVKVLDINGAVMSGVPVTFAISGANQRSTEVTTDATGIGSFSYTGTNPGVDDIQAFATIHGFETVSNQETIHWTVRSNTAPVVSAGTSQTITLPSTASLNGSATDDGLPAGASLSYQWSKVSGPGNVSFTSPNSAATQAAFSIEGTYVLQLTVSDSQLSASATTSITVNPGPNVAPVIDAGADIVLPYPEKATSLSGTVSDDGKPAGATVTVHWDALVAPGSVTFADPNLAATQVTFGAPGVYQLQLSASDTLLTSSDTVQVTVPPVGPNQAPVVNAGADILLPYPQVTASLSGTATDDGLPNGDSPSVQWDFSSGPGTVTITDPNSLTTQATFSAPGVYQLQLTASDTLLTTTDTVQVTVNPAVPTATLNLTNGLEVTKPLVITGSVNTTSWTLQYAFRDSDQDSALQFKTFASGTSANVSGTIDPTVLLNGQYVIRLVASTFNGQSLTTSANVTVSRNMKVGIFTLAFTDLDVPLAGLPIQVTRTYDSRDKGVGDFGIGWRLAVKSARVQTSGALGHGWEEVLLWNTYVNSYCVQPTRPHTVTITFVDGKQYKFEAAANPKCTQFGPNTALDMVFNQVATGGGTEGAKLEVINASQLLVDGSVPGAVDLIDFSGAAYSPSLFRLTTAEGYIYELDKSLGVTKVTDPNGNFLTIAGNGITHSSGVSVQFQRDTQGRITSITDPEGHSLTYNYSAAGDLESVIDRASQTTTFEYVGDHYLQNIFDPRGVRALRNEYDSSGRLIKTIDPAGHEILYDHDITGQVETVTDRLGNSTTYEYDNHGNVTRMTDALLNVTTYTYDSNDHKLTETDPLLRTTTYKYDASGNRISEEDPLHHITTYTYNARKEVLTVKEPLGHITTNSYDGNGNIRITEDPLHNQTVTTYYDVVPAVGFPKNVTDPTGAVTSFFPTGSRQIATETDALGHVTAYTYDNNGNRLTQTVHRTKPDGSDETLVTTYEYDGNNRLTKTTFPDGTFTRTVYNSIGKQAESYDQLGRKTSYEYDDQGRLSKTTYPDLTFEQFTYDLEGPPPDQS